MVLETNNQEQLIFKHAISTVVMPRRNARIRPASGPRRRSGSAARAVSRAAPPVGYGRISPDCAVRAEQRISQLEPEGHSSSTRSAHRERAFLVGSISPADASNLAAMREVGREVRSMRAWHALRGRGRRNERRASRRSFSAEESLAELRELDAQRRSRSCRRNVAAARSGPIRRR